MKNKKIYKKAIEKWGERSQIIKCAEELSELSKELLKIAFYEDIDKSINAIKKVSEEMADVKITLKQMSIIFNNKKEIEKAKKYKLKRLETRINFHEK